jgi:hypothetical protein
MARLVQQRKRDLPGSIGCPSWIHIVPRTVPQRPHFGRFSRTFELFVSLPECHRPECHRPECHRRVPHPRSGWTSAVIVSGHRELGRTTDAKAAVQRRQGSAANPTNALQRLSGPAEDASGCEYSTEPAYHCPWLDFARGAVGGLHARSLTGMGPFTETDLDQRSSNGARASGHWRSRSTLRRRRKHRPHRRLLCHDRLT